MSIILSVLLLLEYVSFLVYDLVKNRFRLSRHLAIRISAGLFGVTLVALETLLVSPLDIRYLVIDSAASVEILLFYPCSFEKPSIAFVSTALLLLAALFSLVFSRAFPESAGHFRHEREFFSCLVILLVFWIHFFSVAFKRFHGLRLLFKNNAVWHNLEDYSRFIYSIIFLGLVLYSLCADCLTGDAGDMMALSGEICMMGLFAVLYLRDMTGRTFVLNLESERKVKDIIKGNLRTSFIDKAEEDKKMNNLYSRVMLYMNEKKPYLDQGFRMEDMAEALYSNKLYLSRTINLLSGRNFRQFVNYHRIQYAISLFKKDPRLKVGEVSELCGFHSTVTFNMAFKVNMGKTPSEWLRDHSYER